MPSKKRFDQARPFATLGIVLAVWVLLPIVVKRFVRASFFEFQAPLSFAASHVRDLQQYWSLRLHSKDDLIEAGRDLGRLTASYETTVQDNVALRGELQRLESLLRIPPYPGFRAEPARVAQRDFSGWWQEMIIRKGRNYGITVDAPVIFAGGLVGRIREVRAYESVVELISSPGMRLAGVVEGDDRPITYRGGINPPFFTPRGTIEYVPSDITLQGDAPIELVTSGMGGTYPPGLAIGRIIRLQPGTDGMFSSGEVQLDSRLSALREVTVLVPLESAPELKAPALNSQEVTP